MVRESREPAGRRPQGSADNHSSSDSSSSGSVIWYKIYTPTYIHICVYIYMNTYTHIYDSNLAGMSYGLIMVPGKSACAMTAAC